MNHQSLAGDSTLETSDEACWTRSHSVKFYKYDSDLIYTLEHFVTTGLSKGDACVLIMTEGHAAGLAKHLTANGVDLTAAVKDDRYVVLDAAETLARFMNYDEPDSEKFEDVVLETIKVARGDGRGISAFGEMVALLWADGNEIAAIKLERLWNSVIAAENLELLCAYPDSVHYGPSAELVQYINAAHTAIAWPQFQPKDSETRTR